MAKSSRDTVLQRFKISEPKPLLEFLIDKGVRKSRNAIKSLLAHKQITVNGKIVTQFDHQLAIGDIVALMKFDQSRKVKKLKGMTIVYEDEDIIVIDKEAGILSVSTDKEKSKTVYSVLNEYVKRKSKLARVFVLHRLDREMSGLMVFAKSQDIQTIFQMGWDRIVQTYNYTGVVYGELNPKKGTITSWLTENKNFVVFSSPKDNGGLKAVTHYKTIKSANKFSLVEFNLETRRKNQVRVHMNSVEHPIVGDRKYGATTNPIKRIALHAGEMVLIHPKVKSRLEFKSNVPKKMSDLLAKKIEEQQQELSTDKPQN